MNPAGIPPPEGTRPLLTTSPVETAVQTPFPPSALPLEGPATDARHLILRTLDDAKADAVTDIDLMGKTSLADRMIIASGRSERHVGAIAEQVLQALKDEGFGNARVEGMPVCEWVLIDAGDIIVHIFKPEVRNFYNLEKMWSGDRPDERGRG